MRLTSVAGAMVALAMPLVACGSDPDDAERPGPPERLAQAVTRLAEAGTGRFSSTTAGSDGTLHSRIEGDYQLAPPAARATVSRYDARGDRRVTEVLAIGRDVWSRDPGSSPADARCWIHYDVTELFTNGLLVRNGDTYAPAPVAAVGLGSGVYATDGDQVTGTSELSTVLSVADLALPSLLGLDRRAGTRVITTFRLDGEVLAGWKVFVRDAVRKARDFAESSAVGDGRLNALSGLGGSITTELTGLGETIDVAPPPADQVVDYVADPEALAVILSGCSSRGGGG